MAMVPPILVDAGTMAGLLVALVAAGRTPPARWVWRLLVHQPTTEWLRSTVAEVIRPTDERCARVEQRVAAIEHELHPNGGTSLRDRVDATAERVGAPPPPGD